MNTRASRSRRWAALTLSSFVGLLWSGWVGATALEADRECLIRAAFAHPADLAYAKKLAIEVFDEHPVLEPTMHLRCSDLEGVAAFASSYEIIEEDLQAAFARERARIDAYSTTRNVVTSPQLRYQEYLTLENMNAVVDDWAREFPKYVTIEEIGRSLQDRPIRVVNISRFKGKHAPKHRVVILNGHHAREWLASASTLCFTERLLRGIDKDPEVEKLMSYMTYSLIVMGNPDGYVMTHNGKRLQRKNAREVDLNRNWDIAWGTVSSSRKSAEDYHGTGPFSEPETTAYSKFIAKHGEEMIGFVDIHAFLSAIMAPYGYIRKRHPREDEFAALMKKMAGAMTEPGMIKYKTGPIHSTVYQSSGCSEDWVDDKFPQTWSLAIEVRGKRFDEPPSQIEPTCSEIEAALMVYLKEIVPMDGPLPDPEESEDPDESQEPGDTQGSEKGDGSEKPDDSEDDGGNDDGEATEGEDDDSQEDSADSPDEEESEEKSSPQGDDDKRDKGKGGGCRVESGAFEGGMLGWLLLLGGLVRRRKRALST